MERRLKEGITRYNTSISLLSELADKMRKTGRAKRPAEEWNGYD